MKSSPNFPASLEDMLAPGYLADQILVREGFLPEVLPRQAGPTFSLPQVYQRLLYASELGLRQDGCSRALLQKVATGIQPSLLKRLCECQQILPGDETLPAGADDFPAFLGPTDAARQRLAWPAAPETKSPHYLSQLIWRQHKYGLMARDQKAYRAMGPRVAAMAERPLTLLQDLSLQLFSRPDPGNLRNAAQHMWGYVRSGIKLPQKQKETATVAENSPPLAEVSTMELLFEIQRKAYFQKNEYLLNSTALCDLPMWAWLYQATSAPMLTD